MTITIKDFHDIEEIEVEITAYIPGETWQVNATTVSPPNPPEIEFTISRIHTGLDMSDDAWWTFNSQAVIERNAVELYKRVMRELENA